MSSDAADPTQADPPAPADPVSDRFAAAWASGQRPRLEDFLPLAPEADQPGLLRKLLALELAWRARQGEAPTVEEYRRRLPRYAALIAPAFALPPPVIPGYEVLGELGRGGMGVVYKAHQLGFNRMVALKTLLSGAHAGPEDLARFRTEAEAVGRLQHPNIVQVYEIHEHEGRPFFSMEYCPGGGLDRKLCGTPLPPKEAARLVETLARAVHAAHQQHVVHRDLKPANVLLAADGSPKVTDFGLAKRLDEAGTTQSGAVLGTPSYMAPEQARSQSKQIGPATDVYALGAILYECLTGRPPFKAATMMETMRQVMDNEPVPPRRLNPAAPRDLETICLKCLEKAPGRRYASALDMAEDLRRFLADEPVRARPVGALVRCWKWAQRRPAPAAAYALTAVVLLLLTGYGVEWARRQHEKDLADRHAQAVALVHALRTADTSEVPALLDALPSLGDETRPLLEEALRRGPAELREELNLRLGLLRFDPAQADALVVRLPDLSPQQLLVLRQALGPGGARFRDGLWRLLEDPDADTGRRLRAAACLATFDPDSPRWAAAAGPLAAWIVAESLLDAAHWAEAFRPVRSVLLAPLAAVFQDARRRESERDLAAGLLADYARDRPDVLADLAVAADPHQLDLLWPAVLAQKAPVVPLLTAALDRDAAAPDAAGRKGAAAVVLARLREWDPVWPLLKASPYPGVRSWLIHRLAPMGADPAAPAARWGDEPDPSARAALLLALGEFTDKQFPPKEREALLPTLVRSYRDDPDPGVHGAVAWLVRGRWGQGAALDAADAELAGRDPGPRRWSVDGQGRTFALVPGPVVFGMGSPPGEADREEDLEARHRCRIPRGFAVAAREVTVAEFRRFRPDFKFRNKYSPDDDAPIINVTWYDAVAYCRWLSEREKIPEGQMCYPPLDQIKPGMTLPADCLDRTGYRLPTEAEWEYACRAGTVTSRFHGDDADLLGQYAWYAANSGDHTHPGAALKPNDLGLFDMLGNAWEWCQDRQRTYPADGDAEDAGREEVVRDADPRVLRGGAFGWHAGLIRSARRNAQVPSYSYHLYGFRVTRTLPGTAPGRGLTTDGSPPMMTKLVSGGQTGVDRAALDLALELGLPCGGWCPRGRKAEDGTLAERYPLTETPTDVYAERTEFNVRDSDGTLVLVRGAAEGGTKLTIELASRYGKPCLVVDASQAVDLAAAQQWLQRNNIHVLNVAGPRESEAPGLYGQARDLLRRILALPGVIAR